jgi:nucleotide-binding universal stress UspA family protein
MTTLRLLKPLQSDNKEQGMYQNILLPIDATKHSEKTIEYAMNLAKLSQASIIVLHAVEVPRLTNKLVAGARQSDKIILEEDAKKLVGKVVKSLTKAGFSARGVVVMGSAAKAILSVIQSEQPDVVVMGSRGGTLGLGVGGTARRVVRDSSVPVLVVK